MIGVSHCMLIGSISNDSDRWKPNKFQIDDEMVCVIWFVWGACLYLWYEPSRFIWDKYCIHVKYGSYCTYNGSMYEYFWLFWYMHKTHGFMCTLSTCGWFVIHVWDTWTWTCAEHVCGRVYATKIMSFLSGGGREWCHS